MKITFFTDLFILPIHYETFWTKIILRSGKAGSIKLIYLQLIFRNLSQPQCFLSNSCVVLGLRLNLTYCSNVP